MWHVSGPPAMDEQIEALDKIRAIKLGWNAVTRL